MNEAAYVSLPAAVQAIEADTHAICFKMGSDRRTGAFLRALAASRPYSRFLELGTGTGLAAAWLLDGMDQRSTLITVDNDEACISVARRHLAHDPRIQIVHATGETFLRELAGQKFQLVFADTWPGKFWDLDLALELVAEGGLYVVDDLRRQTEWTEQHTAQVAALLEQLSMHPDLVFCPMNWGTGLAIATRRAGKPPSETTNSTLMRNMLPAKS